MKKAKVIVTALVVLAVVGGALAFKAKSATYCYYTLDSNSTCSLVGPIESFTTLSTATQDKKAVLKGTAACPATQTTCDQRINTTTTDN